jgi:hypothetical protein
MFFHPNDGTVPYPQPSDCDNRVLWERIGDLENLVERQGEHINDLSVRLQEYQGRIFYPIDNTN